MTYEPPISTEQQKVILTSYERDPNARDASLEKSDTRDRHSRPKRPVFTSQRELRLPLSISKIRRNVELQPHLFWETSVLRVRAGDQNTTVGKEGGFGVVESNDSSVGEDGHALANRL